MKHYFCTVVNKEYVFKAIALYHSLEMCIDDFWIWILCVDDITYLILNKMNLKNVKLITLKEVEDQSLLKVKESRDIREYCWTLKPVLPLYILAKYGNIEHVMLIDGDLFFFSNVSAVFEEWKGYSIFMCRQRTDKRLEDRNGLFNSGFIGFKNDQNALSCLYWWKEKCIEWCYSKVEANRWSDQKYLDSWPAIFSGVKIINSLGIHAGPWNINGSHISVRNKNIYCDNGVLVAYHFASLKIYNENKFSLHKFRSLKKEVIKQIYLPYIKALNKAIKEVMCIDEHFTYGFVKRQSIKKSKNYYILKE